MKNDFTKESDFENFLLKNLFVACQQAKKGKRNTLDEYVFEMNEAENLIQLRDDILSRRYKPSRSIAFIIRDPVIREIFAAPFRDRIVHHFLFDITYSWWDPRLDNDSYSCRIGKGPQYGIERLQKMMHRAQSWWPNEEIYCLKFDIKSFFMSLERTRLVEKVDWGLKRQFPERGAFYELIRFLWERILLDDPTRGAIRKGDIEKDWASLPESKSLFNQPKGFGIVIGNLTSQLVSNIYMDELDRFMRFELEYKLYGRYVDDFFFLVPQSQMKKAMDDVVLIESKLAAMGLRLHPNKRYIQPIRHGVDFLGQKVYPGRHVPGKRILRNFRRAMYQYAYDDNATLEGITSYLGYFSRMDSSRRLQKIYDSFGVRSLGE